MLNNNVLNIKPTLICVIKTYLIYEFNVYTDIIVKYIIDNKLNKHIDTNEINFRDYFSSINNREKISNINAIENLYIFYYATHNKLGLLRFKIPLYILVSAYKSSQNLSLKNIH